MKRSFVTFLAGCLPHDCSHWGQFIVSFNKQLLNTYVSVNVNVNVNNSLFSQVFFFFSVFYQRNGIEELVAASSSLLPGCYLSPAPDLICLDLILPVVISL